MTVELYRQAIAVLQVAVQRWPLPVAFFAYLMIRRPGDVEMAGAGIVTLAAMAVHNISSAQRKPLSERIQLWLAVLAAAVAILAGIALYALANVLFPPKLYAFDVRRVPGILPVMLAISGSGPDGTRVGLHLGAGCRVPFDHARIEQGQFRFSYEDDFVHPDMALSVSFQREGEAAATCFDVVNLPDNSALWARR